MAHKIWRSLRSFKRNEAGTISLITGISMIPIAFAVGIAFDFARISNAKVQVQSAADAVALAAAAATGSDAQREKVAEAFLKRNLPEVYGMAIRPSIKVSGDEVEVEISVSVSQTLTRLIFLNPSSGLSDGGVDFMVKSKAVSIEGETHERCVLALDPSMANAVYIRGTGDVEVDDCGVHADSTSSSALHVQGNATATALEFTTVGGYQVTGGGRFSPAPEGQQDVVGDPFGLSVTPPAGVCTTRTIKKQDGAVTLTPGKYCNVTLQTQANVTMSPGVYWISGTLSVASHAQLTATGVTLILTGNSSRIDVGSQGIMKLQALASGPYAGFAVIQDPAASPTGVHNVQGGADSFIRGIWYTPKAKLYITGGGGFNLNSAYFPMVVDNVEIGGNGQVHIGFDWGAYGYPKPTELFKTDQASVRLTE